MTVWEGSQVTLLFAVPAWAVDWVPGNHGLLYVAGFVAFSALAVVAVRRRWLLLLAARKKLLFATPRVHSGGDANGVARFGMLG